MMYLKEIEFHNYGPFKGTNKITFSDEASVVFVNGTYQDNPLQSNRAGKSSFIEAILYLLFGQTRGSTKEIDWIFYGEKEMYIKGTIALNGDDITIKRGRTNANKPILEIEGIKGKKKEKEAELIKRIGLSYDDFISTYFFKQRDIHHFMESKPTEKKRLLQKWFNFDRWQVYEAKAKEKHIECEKKVESLRSQIEHIEGRINDLADIEDSKEIQEELTKRKASLVVSNNSLMQLGAELNNLPNIEVITKSIEKYKADLNWCEHEINGAKTTLLNAESQKDSALKKKDEAVTLSKTLTKTSQELLTQLNEVKESLSPIGNHLTKIELFISNTKDMLEKAKNFGGLCPIDNKPCDKGTRIPDFEKELEEELKGYNRERESLIKGIDRINQRVDKLHSNHVYVLSVEEEIAKLNIEADVSKYGPLIDSQNKMLETLDKQRESLTNYINSESTILDSIDSARIADIRNKINDTQKLQTMLNERIDTLNIKLGEIKEKHSQKQQLTKSLQEHKDQLTTCTESMYVWDYITHMFGKNGIPSILVENSLSYIEDFANIMLKDISPTSRIEFSTLKEVTTKETHCSICGSAFGKDKKCVHCGLGTKRNKLKDEINLLIYENNRPLTFSQDSGGGNVLISLAIRLALAKILNKNNNSSEILVLDEIFGSLDPVNRDRVAKVVFNTLLKTCGFRQIFCISHSSIKEFSYKQINVERFDNFSKIST